MRLVPRALGAASAVVLLASLTSLGTAVPASAGDTPTLIVTPDVDPSLPLKVEEGQPLGPGDDCDLDCGEGTNLIVEVSATAPVTNVAVTITAQAGLDVLPQESQTAGGVGPGPDDYFDAEFAIGAQTPGFHTFSFQVTADGVDPVTVTMPYVWLPGGPTLHGQGSLAGRMYGYNSEGSSVCGEGNCRYRIAHTISFLGDHRARFGLADQGRDGCAHLHGCRPYEYDAGRHLLQVGDQTIGAVNALTAPGAWIDDGYWYRLLYPRPGQRLAGAWAFRQHGQVEGHGVDYETLTLTKQGRFTLHYTSTRGGTFSTALRGTYSIGARGALHLRDRRRHLRRTQTLALLTDSQGRPRASVGVWLGIHVDPKRGKDFLDGNRMLPLTSH